MMKYYGTELNKQRHELVMAAGGSDALEWESDRSNGGAPARAWLRTKANSIEGNKKDNVTIIYTPWSNLKKDGSMAVGQVSFHDPRKVKRVIVATRENAIINRLNKTKVEKQVDHENERIERIKKENAVKRTAAAAKVRLCPY